MQCHHGDHIGLFVVGVNVRDQGHFLQKTRQGGVLTILIQIGLDRADQLAKVLQPGLPFLLLGFQHGLVAGAFDDLPHKFIQRQGREQFLQLLHNGVKMFQRTDATAQSRVQPRLRDDFHHRHTLCSGQFRHLVNCGTADFAGRFIDDAPQAHIIPRIHQNRQIGIDVLDLLAVKEPLAAHNAVRDARSGKIGFDGVGLRVHTVQDGVVPQMRPLPQMFTHHIRDVAGLVLFAGGGVVMHLFTVPVLGPQRLALAAVIVLNDAVGRVENVGGGTVVLFQTDGARPGKSLLKMEDVLDGRAAEFVDGLVIVAHNADVVGAACQKAHQMKLRHASVLILVHQHIAEFVLVIAAGILVLTKHVHRMENQVVKVHRAGGFQPARVSGIHLAHQRLLGVARRLGGYIGGGEQLVLEPADLGNGGFHRQEFIVDHQFFIDLLDDPLLVIRIIDGKAGGKSDALRITAQYTHAGGMKGGGMNVPANGVPQHGL